MCNLKRQIGKAPCIQGLTYECSNDGAYVWVTGGCSAVLSTSVGSAACHTVDPQRVYLCHVRADHSRPKLWNVSALGRWAYASGGDQCDFFCRHRRNTHAVMAKLLKHARAQECSAADARRYLTTVYRDPRIMLWEDEKVLARVRLLDELGSWVYHSTSTPSLQLGCAHNLLNPRRSSCQKPRAVRHGLVFCSPYKIRNLHWFGFFAAGSDQLSCRAPAAPSFHPDNTWCEVVRIASTVSSSSAADTPQYGFDP